MPTYTWIGEKSSSHNYGIEILSSDKYTVENFVYNRVKTLCEKLNIKYFIQGFNLRDYGVSWAFVEFFSSDDDILSFVEEYNKLYKEDLNIGDPSREFLQELKLM